MPDGLVFLSFLFASPPRPPPAESVTVADPDAMASWSWSEARLGIPARRAGILVAACMGCGAAIEFFMIKVWIKDTNCTAPRLSSPLHSGWPSLRGYQQSEGGCDSTRVRRARPQWRTPSHHAKIRPKCAEVPHSPKAPQQKPRPVQQYPNSLTAAHHTTPATPTPTPPHQPLLRGSRRPRSQPLASTLRRPAASDWVRPVLQFTRSWCGRRPSAGPWGCRRSVQARALARSSSSSGRRSRARRRRGTKDEAGQHPARSTPHTTHTLHTAIKSQHGRNSRSAESRT